MKRLTLHGECVVFRVTRQRGGGADVAIFNLTCGSTSCGLDAAEVSQLRAFLNRTAPRKGKKARS